MVGIVRHLGEGVHAQPIDRFQSGNPPNGGTEVLTSDGVLWHLMSSSVWERNRTDRGIAHGEGESMKGPNDAKT